MIKKILIGFVMSLFLVGTANAWYIELGSSYAGSYGSTVQDAIFQSDTDPAGSINLNGAALAVTWDSGASAATSPYAVAVTDHTVGRGVVVWTAPGLAYGVDGSIIYNAVGAEPFSAIGQYMPADGDVLMSFAWGADPGATAFTSYLLLGVETVGINVAEAPVDWEISVDGKQIGPSSGDVPIPGAVYLLASGLIGLIGLRRKMS